MTDDQKKRVLEHYSNLARNAAYDSKHFEGKVTITATYDSFVDGFLPCGNLTGYLATALCRCGEVVMGSGTHTEIAYTILQGKHFSHLRDSPNHPEEWIS